MFSCKNGKNTLKNGKSYYPSGKIKQVYKYLNDNDTCLFDTFYTYYENGVLEAKIVYDSSFKETGTSQLYYSNGILKATIDVVNGLAQGVQVKYDSLGNLNYKEFNFNDVNVGDMYFYKSNKVWTYQFFDFRRNLLTSIEYDENWNIKKQEGDRGFIDSIKVEPIQNGFNLYKIFILQPNPPLVHAKLATIFAASALPLACAFATIICIYFIYNQFPITLFRQHNLSHCCISNN